jgi:hypothetical protein
MCIFWKSRRLNQLWKMKDKCMQLHKLLFFIYDDSFRYL